MSQFLIPDDLRPSLVGRLSLTFRWRWSVSSFRDPNTDYINIECLCRLLRADLHTQIKNGAELADPCYLLYLPKSAHLFACVSN